MMYHLRILARGLKILSLWFLPAVAVYLVYLAWGSAVVIALVLTSTLLALAYLVGHLVGHEY